MKFESTEVNERVNQIYEIITDTIRSTAYHFTTVIGVGEDDSELLEMYEYTDRVKGSLTRVLEKTTDKEIITLSTKHLSENCKISVSRISGFIDTVKVYVEYDRKDIGGSIEISKSLSFEEDEITPFNI